MKNTSLQMVRALAAFLVLADHSLAYFVAREGLSPHLLHVAWRMGETGVAIFFVLSGYVVSLSIGDDGSHPGNLAADFLKRRLLRVVPLYWLVTFVYFIRTQFSSDPSGLEEFARSMLFIPYLNEEGLFRPVVGVGWTLNYEMFFYVVFAASLFSLGRLAKYGVVVVMLALLASTYTMSNIGGALGFYQSELVGYFAVGVSVQILHQHFQMKLLSWVACTSGCVGVIVACMGYVIRNPDHGASYCLIALTATLTVVIAGCEGDRGAGRGATRVAIDRAGDASYAVYLSHIFFVKSVVAVLGAAGLSALSLGLSVFVSSLVLFLIGHLVHISVEARVNSMARELVFERSRIGKKVSP